ncbi:MAG: TolC family protein [Leptospiraceae bacterium]|nr:TolC family protein [Leptospiraceae bacterium]MDW8306351.1 TolC family protein [Leptospiraceae bacterium]
MGSYKWRFPRLLLLLFTFPTGFLSSQTQEPAIIIEGVRFRLEDAIDYVMRHNLTLQSAKYDVIMSDTPLRRFEKKFAPQLSTEGKYTRVTNPVNLQTAFGNESQQAELSLSLTKIFSTGTMLTAGVRDTFFEVLNAPGFGTTFFTIRPDPPFHRPALFFSIQQELLKNAFGYTDRKQRELLRNATLSQRAATINLLSQVVVQVLIDYWQVTIRSSALENAILEENSTRNVRNIIANNTRLGLAESFELNQYNALLENAISKRKLAEQQLIDAQRKMLRSINMPPDTKIEGVTELVETLPANLDPEEALKAAFQKRVDYQNAKNELERAKLQLEIEENNALPSLTASFSLTTQGQNQEFFPAFRTTFTLDYPVWSVGLKMTYPLWDEEIKTNLRNARFAITQARMRLENLTKEITDEIYSRLETVKLLHQVLSNSQKAAREAQLYYERLLARARQGKFNSVIVKQALDNLILLKQKELEARVNYNIALLQLDLAKNEIFERYNVNVEKYLKDVTD